MKSKFKIEGLDCANCAAELESAIKKIEGITEVSISFMTERLVLEYNENMKDEIIEKMKKVIKKEEPDVTIKDL
jgi:copper chaperone CopZ